MGVPWWAALLGALFTSIGVGFVIAKAFATHDWKTCQCVDCRRRRYHRHTALGRYVTGVEPDGDLIWSEADDSAPRRPGQKYTSTARLEIKMVVVVNGHPYLITDIKTDIKGYLVQCQSTKSRSGRMPFIVSIPWKNAKKTMWEVR